MSLDRDRRPATSPDVATPAGRAELSYLEAEQILLGLARPGNGTRVDVGSRPRGPAATPTKATTAAGEGGGGGVETGDEKVRRAEARYRTLVEQLPAVTFMAALEGGANELYVSPQIESLLGFSQKEWLEDPILWYRQLHPDDRVRWHAEFAQTCASGKHFRAEYRFLARDGHVVWIHGEAQVVHDERGNPLYLQGIAFDITARKRAEEALRRAHDDLERRVGERTAELARANVVLVQEIRERERVEGELRRANADLVVLHERAVEASQVKSTFLANMSHELRTPLNAIIGYSELLQELAAKKVAKDPSADLEKINRAGKHLLAIINDILDLSKIEAGKVDLLPEHLDAAELAREMATSVRPLASKNGNTLEVLVDGDLGTMFTDATRLRQCLLNLLSNACKFTRNGAVSLAAARERTPGGDTVVFRVRDSGIGLSPEQVGRLFRAFSQADATTTRKFGGTGLGLAITRKICQMMGGDVSVESVPGQGSTFTIRVPADLGATAAARSEPASPAAAPVAAPRPDGPAVLVIDDDPMVHDLTARFLADEGYAVVHAQSGRDGLRLAREVRPCAITLDVMMPGLDGWAALSALKADPELSSIPVILVSILDDRNRGFALGASDYLIKPIDKKRLLGVLGSLKAPAPDRSVLIVEDDPDTRDLLARLLRREGWSVRAAADGHAGLRSVAEEVPALILLDLMMPRMDGFEFVRELRRAEVESWRSVPVVVITAKDITEDDLERLRGYAHRVFRKDARHYEGLLKEVGAQLRLVARARPADGPAGA
jgi:PAS domain S-box-containing protein